MGRLVVRILLVLGVAYVVGWMSDAVLNDDPCISASVRELDDMDYVQRWFPVRTDCQVTTPSGASRIEPGSAEVFLAMFALVLVAGLALLTRVAEAIRTVAVLAAAVAAFLVIFIV